MRIRRGNDRRKYHPKYYLDRDYFHTSVSRCSIFASHRWCVKKLLLSCIFFCVLILCDCMCSPLVLVLFFRWSKVIVLQKTEGYLDIGKKILTYSTTHLALKLDHHYIISCDFPCCIVLWPQCHHGGVRCERIPNKPILQSMHSEFSSSPPFSSLNHHYVIILFPHVIIISCLLSELPCGLAIKRGNGKFPTNGSSFADIICRISLNWGDP